VTNYNVTKHEDGDSIGLYALGSCVQDNKCSLSHQDVNSEVGTATLNLPDDAAIGSTFEIRYIREGLTATKQLITVRDNTSMTFT
jgi:hypothetical protein